MPAPRWRESVGGDGEPAGQVRLYASLRAMVGLMRDALRAGHQVAAARATLNR
jgi:hypothetical protein